MNKHKIILHLDMNSYFATMEQQAYPHLRGKPVGVAGKGPGERTIISGASIEAKRMGVKGVMSTWEAKKICPELIIVPANYDRYIFTSKRIFSLLETLSPKIEIFSIDEAFMEINGSYDDAILIAKQAKALIRRQIGEWVTCSVGISYGKTLAKLASELQKPDGLTVIKPEGFTDIAKKIPIEDLCGIGRRLAPKLHQLGVSTIFEMGRIPKSTLTTTFGDFTGSWMHNIGNGIDNNQLHSFRDLPEEKSIGHAYTLPRDIASTEDIKSVLLYLSEKVGRRLRKKGLMGRTVSVYVRFGDGGGWGDRLTTQEYILDGYQIYRAGERLVEKNSYLRPVRLVSITISNLSKQTNLTAPLFSDQVRYEKLLTAVDDINNRFGSFTIHRGRLNLVKDKIYSLPDGRNKRLYTPSFNSFSKRFS